jgi:hypothetical protein
MSNRVGDKKSPLSEEEIDEIVAAQADEDSAWEKPIRRSFGSTTNDSPEFESGPAHGRVESDDNS